MAEYRIREYGDVFSIEVKAKEIRAYLSWKKRKDCWYRASTHGHAMYGFHQSASPTFTTLDQARERVEQFKAGATYHY